MMERNTIEISKYEMSMLLLAAHEKFEQMRTDEHSGIREMYEQYFKDIDLKSVDLYARLSKVDTINVQ